MGAYEENYLSRRPQEYCHMCGRCCRVSTTSKTYEELLKLQQQGDEGAKDFLKIFVPYPSIEDARKVDADLVDNIISMLKNDESYDESRLTFYGCRYILDNNMCSIYQERPSLCKYCPSTPWAIVPPGCGFEGWLFLEREKAKEKIRKAKEDLLELKLLKLKNNDPKILHKINLVENKIQSTIDMFKKYGSYDW